MKNKIKYLLIAFCVFCAIGVDAVRFNDLYDTTKSVVVVGREALKLDLVSNFIVFFVMYGVFSKNKKKSNWMINILSIIFSIIMIFGSSYMAYGNESLVCGSFKLFILAVIMAIGYFFLFSLCLCYVFEWLDKQKIKDASNKVMMIFKKHPFIISLIIMIICWIPYIKIFYPSILSPDPSNQIMQFFGIRTKYADFSVLIDENVTMTNHHPVTHTLLLGSCLKLGRNLVDDNFGLFIYSLIQIIVLSCTLAYTIKYMLKNMNLPNKVGLFALAFYALTPMFPFYAMSAVKDVLFGCFIILYVMMLHRIIVKNGIGFKIWHYALMILLMLLVILFRNNGIHVIVLSFPFLILAVKERWKPFLIIFAIIIGLNICYTKVALPAFKITPGSVREMLSIPFQQTARYAFFYDDELSDKDKEIIDKILGYDTLAERYDPELSDPVKNEFNKNATSEDMKAYFKVWFKCFFKHPISYLNATINNTYGFFYPEKLSWSLYHNYNQSIVKAGFDYHYESEEEERQEMYEYGEKFREIPVIGLLVNIGFNTWIVFICTGYMVYKKRYKEVVLYLPALITILVAVAGPANAYFRYALPYVFAMPLLVSFALEKKV